MNKFDERDYVKLLRELYNSAYEDNDFESGLDNDSIYYEPRFELIKKFNPPNINSCADLTTTNQSQIKEYLLKYRNIKTGPFLVKITNYHCSPSNSNNDSLELDMVIYEEFKANSRQDNKIISKVDISKDVRFNSKTWRNKFNNFKIGSKIKIDLAVDIIRWLQTVDKLSGFL